MKIRFFTDSNRANLMERIEWVAVIATLKNHFVMELPDGRFLAVIEYIP